jgi:hypothetical protein
MARFFNANKILNRVAVEVGLTPSNDAFADPDQSFQQLGGLLNSAGQELSALWGWELLKKPWNITVTATDVQLNAIPLPTDYASLVDQTGWDKQNNVPIQGPMSSQEWAFIKERGIATNTIYPVFRLARSNLEMYPMPVEGAQFYFEYISRGWVLATSFTLADEVTAGSEAVLYKPIMMIKFLKVKWLEAKGLDASAARLEFDNVLQSELGKDSGAPRLNAGYRSYGPRYLDGFYSVPDSGYGGV